eukprot:TRINITY_DN58044_c0_g1_i1.p1 TRINITY_DN58044_c0_g1~~TRINITY_DN58044_c0_g1_i1.p1  ORF type:complete len:188 (+),score=38.73 TRINITY_DN58044_c0_g1_i1:319-882(+)
MLVVLQLAFAELGSSLFLLLCTLTGKGSWLYIGSFYFDTAARVWMLVMAANVAWCSKQSYSSSKYWSMRALVATAWFLPAVITAAGLIGGDVSENEYSDYHIECWYRRHAQVQIGVGFSAVSLAILCAVAIVLVSSQRLPGSSPREVDALFGTTELNELAVPLAQLGADESPPVSYTHLTLPTKRIV